MSNSSKSGSPAYLKWGAGILLVLAFAFAWYVIAEQDDSNSQTEPAAVEATADSSTTVTTEANPRSIDSTKVAKVGEVLGELAQEESVEPYAPASK